MSKLHRLLLCLALAMAGMVLAVPVAAEIGAAPGYFADESASCPQLATTELQDQIPAPHQELDNRSAAASGDKQPASAASSNSASNNGSASSTDTKDKKNKKKDKSKAKPARSEQEEEFDRVLLGIHG